MFIGPPLNVTVPLVVPLVLGNKQLQYLMNAIPALPVTVNELAELLTCLLKHDEL